MTIIATPDGKYYTETWDLRDRFQKRRITEVSKREVDLICAGCDDYVVYRPLTIKDRVDVILGGKVS